jgi:hypothetical protein
MVLVERLGVGILLVSTGLVLAQPASAANRWLDKARKAYENLDYAKTQTLLQRALKLPSTTEEEVEIYFLLGTLHVIYGREGQAKEAFREVLARNQGFELPADTSPKIRAAFAEAQAAGPAPPPEPKPEATPEPAPEARTDTAGGSEGSSTTPTEAGTESPTEPPPAKLAEVDPLALVGGGDAMMPAMRLHHRGPPFYQTWWFWTIIGAAVAGGGGYLTYYLVQPRYPDRDFGPIPMR